MEKITFTGDNLGEVMEFFGTEKAALIATDTHDICGRAVMKGDSFRKLNGHIWRADEVDPVPYPVYGKINPDRITFTGQNAVDLFEFIKGVRDEKNKCFNKESGAIVFKETSRDGQALIEVGVGDTVIRDGSWFVVKRPARYDPDMLKFEAGCIEGDAAINHPSHYGSGTYEAIKVIEAWDLGFHLSNVLKYTARAGKKNDELEDLKKAQWYLERKIKQLENGAKNLLP